MDEQNDRPEQAEPELFPLDEAACQMVAELDEQEKQIQQNLTQIQTARNAILAYFLRTHKLAGNWQVAANRRELVRQPEPQPVQQ